MNTCANGWPALDASECHKWQIPGTERHFLLAPGAAGFILAHTALWYHEKIERLDGGTWDDWGYAFRPIRGTRNTISNHAGYAIDTNATRHPLGVPTGSTLTPAQVRRIRKRLRWLRGVVRWGGDYKRRPDAMHWEIVGNRQAARALAAFLAQTPRGRRLRAANPAGAL